MRWSGRLPSLGDRDRLCLRHLLRRLVCVGAYVRWGRNLYRRRHDPLCSLRLQGERLRDHLLVCQRLRRNRVLSGFGLQGEAYARLALHVRR